MYAHIFLNVHVNISAVKHTGRPFYHCIDQLICFHKIDITSVQIMYVRLPIIYEIFFKLFFADMEGSSSNGTILDKSGVKQNNDPSR